MKKSLILAGILAGLASVANVTGFGNKTNHKPSRSSKSSFRARPERYDQRNASKSQRVMRTTWGWNVFAIGARRIDRNLMKERVRLKAKLARAKARG